MAAALQTLIYYRRTQPNTIHHLLHPYLSITAYKPSSSPSVDLFVTRSRFARVCRGGGGFMYLQRWHPWNPSHHEHPISVSEGVSDKEEGRWRSTVCWWIWIRYTRDLNQMSLWTSPTWWTEVMVTDWEMLKFRCKRGERKIFMGWGQISFDFHTHTH